MDDNWMAEAFQRVDEREARERGAYDARAEPSSGIFLPVFFAVALGVPVGLWLYNLDFGSLLASIWEVVVGRLAG